MRFEVDALPPRVMQVEDIRPSGWACAYLVSNGEDAILIDPVWIILNTMNQFLENVN